MLRCGRAQFVIHRASLDFAALETAFGYKHKSASASGSGAAAAIDPYIMIRINDNAARSYRTTTVKDPAHACTWEQTFRVWFNADDKVTVYLVDDNLFKDTYVRQHDVHVTGHRGLPSTTRSFPIRSWVTTPSPPRSWGRLRRAAAARSRCTLTSPRPALRPRAPSPP